jgi:hypothetical protein
VLALATMRTLAMLAVAALASCKSGSKSGNPPADKLTEQREAAKADPPTPPPPAPTPTAASFSSADDLWTAYVAAHVGATPANALETGKKIWPMLDDDAQKLVADAVDQQLANLSMNVKLSAEELRYKMIGESAAARAETIAKTPPSEMTRDNDIKLPSGSVKGGVHWRLRAPDGTKLEYVAESLDGKWHIAPSASLFVSDQEVFKAPAGKQGPTGVASAEAASERWKQVLETGNGWDAYNVMSPVMRDKLHTLVAQVGGNGADDVAKIFEKTIVDRRNRGVHVTKTAISGKTATSASLAFTYSDGKTDNFNTVLADGVWWIEMPL